MAGPIKIRPPGSKQASFAPNFTRFELGTRPPSLRSPRIKPAEGVTQYAKQLNVAPAQPGFGTTGKTGES